MMKQAAAILLALVIVLTVFPAMAADTLTRAEFLVSLNEAANVNDKIYLDRYADVVQSDSAADAIEGASVCGIVHGTARGGALYFGPDEAITREEGAAMVLRVLEFLHVVLPEEGEASFRDMDAASDWAKEDVAMAARIQLVGGDTFRPRAILTRAEGEAMVARMREIADAYPLAFGTEADDALNRVRASIKTCTDPVRREKAEAYLAGALQHLSFDAQESERARAVEEIRMAEGVLQAERTSFLPGGYWFDDHAALIQTHGGGVMWDPVSERYYWYGEARDGAVLSDELRQFANMGWRIGLGCYSSSDLYNWKFESIAMEMLPWKDAQELPESDIALGRVFERPHVIYNEKTGKYVMWAHIDSGNYGYAQAGVAVSDSPTGPFQYLGSSRPHGKMSRDMNVFVDDDGTAYLYYTSDENATIYCSKLTEDYLGHTEEYASLLDGQYREAPAVFKYRDRYYLVSSGCTGWAPNEAKYAVADSPMGPWTDMGNPCFGENANLTFGGQSASVFPLDAEKGQFIFMADIWRPSNHNESGYIWLPIRMSDDGKMQINWVDEWTLEDLEMSVSTEHSVIVHTYGTTPAPLPERVNVLLDGQRQSASVAWDVSAMSPDMPGHYTIQGAVADFGGLRVTAEIYNFPNNLTYFVNCGAEDAAELAALAQQGQSLWNSVSDQAYGADVVSGKQWGYMADHAAGSRDGSTMYDSVRYDYSEGGEESIETGLSYQFEVDANRTYTVLMGISDPWGEVGRYEDLWVNGECVTKRITPQDGAQAFVYSGITAADGMIEVKVTRNALSLAEHLDPVLSWVMVAEEGASAIYTMEAVGTDKRLSLTNGAITLEPRSDAPGERWSFDALSDGSFTITEYSGKTCLDVLNFSMDPGIGVIAYQNNRSSNQCWMLEKQPDGSYLIQNVNSKLYLTWDDKLIQDVRENATRWRIGR